jgi:FAD:protein FMN transferase
VPFGLQRVHKQSHVLGSTVSLTVLHEDTSLAEEAIEAAFRELEAIESVMSIYRPASQVCRLNRDSRLDNPDPHLLSVLNFARRVSAVSDGAFDITVQPLWEIFYRAKQSGRLPDEQEITAAREKVNWRRVQHSKDQVTLLGAGTAITLNGIAQGYAADCVKNVLSREGITHALVDCGEISAIGKTEENAPWKVGIQHPREEEAFISIAQLSGRCLATSGDYATRFGGGDGDAFRWNHLFDPKTGRSPELLASVSVAANTAMEADALSTAVFVAGIERGRKLIEAHPGADALLVLKNGRTLTTKGFPC